MRKHYLLMLLGLTAFGASAQTFSEDFEAYTSGDYIAESSEEWDTWGSKPGSNEDVQIVDNNAHSGTQSIYLSSTTGGPQDLVLPFGATHDLGLFDLELMLKVETGKGAYFNIQGEEKAGESWVLNFQSSKTGDFEVYNDAGVLLRGTISNDEWTKVGLKADLTYNKWSFYINDALAGSWNNEVNTLGGLNLYPVNNMDENGGSGYWIDDVSFAYQSVELTGTNATITKVDYDGVRLVGKEMNIESVVRNVGNEVISAVELSYSYNGESQKQTFSKLSLASGATAVLSFDAPITLGAEEALLTAEILAVNTTSGDDNNDDNTLVTTITPIIPGANRMVVLEEGTGTWCGWCPRGAVSLEQLEEKYGDYFQGIAIHSGDPMAAPLYTQQFVDAYVPGFPSGQLNRSQTLGMNPGASESAFLEALVEPAVTSMEIGGSLSDGSMLTVSVTYKFSEAVNEQLRVACAIVENGVTGTDEDYGQSNYYANNANGDMFGWEDKPSTVPASDMVYHDVARAISPSFRGSDELPATLSAGESHTFQFTFELSEEWDLEELHIVPLCFKEDNTIENGASFTLNETVENDLAEGQLIAGVSQMTKTDLIKMYPNPATSQVNFISQGAGILTIYNMAGKLVQTENIHSGVQTLSIEAFETGIYTVRFTSAQGVSNTTLVVK